MGELIDARLSVLAVSLVGASRESYAKAHPGVPAETFDCVLDSLTQLQRLKREKGSALPKLDLRFIALAGSHTEIKEMVNLGIQLRANSVHLAPLRNRSIGNIGSIGLNAGEEKLAIDSLRQLQPLAKSFELHTNLDEMMIFHRFGSVSSRFPCYAGWFDARVQVDGAIEFCVRCKRILGNLNESPLYEIWQDSNYKTLRSLAKNPATRSRIGDCDCDRCCHFYSNWRIACLLSTFRLAPAIVNQGNRRSTMVGCQKSSEEHRETVSGVR